ncbi:MAG: hypothetical protein IPL27_24085 [Lewinellaceae bacterium]|nr:hypothetical protein [Lewinellaceae bacterium]
MIAGYGVNRGRASGGVQHCLVLHTLRHERQISGKAGHHAQYVGADSRRYNVRPDAFYVAVIRDVTLQLIVNRVEVRR